jgi:hypothetical protein
MKNVILIFILIFSACTTKVEKRFISKDGEKFEATDTWEFELNELNWAINPEFTVAKHLNGGYLNIAFTSPSKSDIISDTLTVYMNNGSSIKCNDLISTTNQDNQIIALYNLMESDISLLKLHRITRIEFSILDRTEEASNLLADNKKEVVSYIHAAVKNNYYKTEVEISELFK